MDEYLSALCRATTCAISVSRISIKPSRPKTRRQTVSKDSGKTVLIFCDGNDTSENDDITCKIVRSVWEGTRRNGQTVVPLTETCHRIDHLWVIDHH